MYHAGLNILGHDAASDVTLSGLFVISVDFCVPSTVHW